MKIIITGAAGLIGSHLTQSFSSSHDVLPLKHSDLDITDSQAVASFLNQERPDLIVNCATIEVDDCERDPELARAIHVEGPRSLARAAASVGGEFIHFSTNYVFDGREEGRAPYTFQDKAHPVNVYGKVKLAGESAVRDACPHTFIIRTSWVYGRGKKTFLSTVYQELLAGRPVRAVADNWANTTYVVDLVSRIGELLPRKRYGTYHVVNQGVCSYSEFALEAGRILHLEDARLTELVQQIEEAETKRPAPRPRYTPMQCLMSDQLGLTPMRHWRSALKDYLMQATDNA
ncbi:MAG: dTDP-4-dehydrorhamnose reductase [Deltaproteobacteria bacterium]|nr:dTDP-4-dehydrorhamnose reductase [Deltaproteobacteria bacterium]